MNEEGTGVGTSKMRVRIASKFSNSHHHAIATDLWPPNSEYNYTTPASIHSQAQIQIFQTSVAGDHYKRRGRIGRRCWKEGKVNITDPQAATIRLFGPILEASLSYPFQPAPHLPSLSYTIKPACLVYFSFYLAAHTA